ncbi:MAG: gamma carbonic anhydrase family protein [Actinomycetota bacterium]|nr:gamma carbonic anhydrase family protein [Actinomycetota bacterium]
MLIEHHGARPRIHPSAYVAPNAVLCGDVAVGPDCRILFGAILTAEDGPVRLGERCIVMENAVLRGRADHPVHLGDRVLIGPHAHVNGAEIGDEAFVATGASLFPGSRLGAGAEIRINGVLHVNSSLPDGAELPIGWIAVGDPAQMFPPKAHDEIWAIQRTLDFAGTVAGVDTSALPRGSAMSQLTATYAALYGRHRDDEVIDG